MKLYILVAAGSIVALSVLSPRASAQDDAALITGGTGPIEGGSALIAGDTDPIAGGTALIVGGTVLEQAYGSYAG
jgi:hypothetical protein